MKGHGSRVNLWAFTLHKIYTWPQFFHFPVQTKMCISILKYIKSVEAKPLSVFIKPGSHISQYKRWTRLIFKVTVDKYGNILVNTVDTRWVFLSNLVHHVVLAERMIFFIFKVMVMGKMCGYEGHYALSCPWFCSIISMSFTLSFYMYFNIYPKYIIIDCLWVFLFSC